jgi:hypothetical protein
MNNNKDTKIPGFDMEYILNGDEIFNFKKGVKTSKSSHFTGGYKHFALKQNGVWKNIRIHRIIASLFIPNPLKKTMVNHKDGNKLNNKIENLEWVTPEENNKHSRDVLGNTCIGNKNGCYGFHRKDFLPTNKLQDKLKKLGVARVNQDIMSLSKILPITVHIYHSIDYENKWVCWCNGHDVQRGNTIVDAMASMLIYLLENHLLALGVSQSPKG